MFVIHQKSYFHDLHRCMLSPADKKILVHIRRNVFLIFDPRTSFQAQ